MKQKIYRRHQAFVVCACCGKSYKFEEVTPQLLKEHQKNNTQCTGYFNVEIMKR